MYFQNELVSSTFYKFGFNTKICDQIHKNYRENKTLSPIKQINDGYFNLTKYKCTKSAIDSLAMKESDQKSL